MGTEDKLYKKIQQAAENATPDTFPGMEKVWARVEEKIETGTVIKYKFLWKKWAIAASFLLFMTIGYHFYNQNEIIDKTKEFSNPDAKNVLEEVNSSESEALSLDYEKVDTVLKKQLEQQTLVGVPENEETIFPEEIQFKNNDEVVTYVKATKPEVEESKVIFEKVAAPVMSSNAEKDKKVKENSIVTSGYLGKQIKTSNSASFIEQKEQKVKEDLVIINDEVSDYKTLNNLTTEVLDSIVILPEPLYIINGVEYSEESLYGKNPTSPYAPLSKQKITKTKVINKEDAVKIYGEKGKKGVIIIETKRGKPVKK